MNAVHRRRFLLVLALYLGLAFAFSVTIPLGEGPDEADHYAYARYIGLESRLPVGPEMTQGKHPPLYHGLAGLLSAWTGMDFDFLRSNPDAFPPGPDAPPNFFVHTTLEAFPWRGGALAMHIGRLLSILLGAITVWATWQLGAVAFPARPEIGLLAAAFLAGLPGFLAISAVMNNDNAAGAAGAVSLLLCARILRQGLTARRSLWLGVTFGLGLLAKVGTLALWPLAAIAVAGALWAERRARQTWMRAAGRLALIWGLGLAVASPWLLRNWQLYGDPLGWELVRATVDQRTAPLALADLAWLARGLYHYFWGRFGPVGQVWLPNWVYTLAGLGAFLLFVGAVLYLWRRRNANHRRPFVLLLLVAAPALVLTSIVQYSTIALGTDQARLMWPAISAIAVWVGLGMAGLIDLLTPRLPQCGLIGSLGAIMPLFGLLALLLVLRPAYSPPPPALAPGAAPTESVATFGDHFELVAVELPSTPVQLGEPASITLLWRARQPLHEDLRPALRLVHQDGWLATEHDHSPAQGRYATDRWRPGEIIADAYRLMPNPSASGEFTVMLGVRPFHGDWLPIHPPAASPFLPLGAITYGGG